jgi:hypothetical protein
MTGGIDLSANGIDPESGAVAAFPPNGAAHMCLCRRAKPDRSSGAKYDSATGPTVPGARATDAQVVTRTDDRKIRRRVAVAHQPAIM